MRYREILARTTARYLRVRPDGIEIAPGQNPLSTLLVQIFDHSPARTCYQKRRPVCRSLDGLRALGNPSLLCRHCELRPQCTPQVRLNLIHDNVPYQLLLAFTSARNFLAYLAALQQQNRDLAEVRTRIRVSHRLTWGELHFEATAEQ